MGMRSAFPTAPLGVGLVYAPGLEPLIRGEPGLVDVLEIEPQTFWRKPAAGRYVVDTIRLNRLAEQSGSIAWPSCRVQESYMASAFPWVVFDLLILRTFGRLLNASR